MKIIPFLIICLIPLTSSGENRKEKRPNILFVFTDDHAPHAILHLEGVGDHLVAAVEVTGLGLSEEVVPVVR